MPRNATIAPWLSVRDAAAAVAFYKAAFGAVERYRLEDGDGTVMVAQLAIGGADLWLQHEPGARSASDDAIRLIMSVDDPDAVFQQAVAAGATSVAEVHEEHGWRSGRVIDPFGHDWELARPL